MYKLLFILVFLFNTVSAEEPKKQFTAEEFLIHVTTQQTDKKSDISIEINTRINGEDKICKVICK